MTGVECRSVRYAIGAILLVGLSMVTACQTTESARPEAERLPPIALQLMREGCLTNGDEADSNNVFLFDLWVPADEYLNQYCSCFVRRLDVRMSARQFLEMVIDASPDMDSATEDQIVEYIQADPRIREAGDDCQWEIWQQHKGDEAS